MIAVQSPADIGSLIRKRRKKLGYTLAEVAEANSCSIRFLSEVERGKPGANIGQILQIANSLGLDFAIAERGDGTWR
ncbi:MAG: helix-turn-helix transcriptional regulator [Eggerthellaceae bacterium]|nr:helix-turn-helix transcriptional regulator [Eggerthellaceae bacterium]